MLASVTIVVTLAALAFPAYKTYTAKAEEKICIGNLRNLHAAFSTYVYEGWPQVPEGIELGSQAEQRWWVETAERDLKIGASTWQCPTLRRLFMSEKEKDRPIIHYLPTPFSGEPGKADKNGAMPWFIEIGDAHGRGNMLVRANGDVEPVPR